MWAWKTPASTRNAASRKAVSREDTDLANLVGDVGNVGGPVAGGDAHEHEQTAIDLSHQRAGDADRRAAHALKHGAHGLRRGERRREVLDGLKSPIE
jgi:hypothetical protein